MQNTWPLSGIVATEGNFPLNRHDGLCITLERISGGTKISRILQATNYLCLPGSGPRIRQHLIESPQDNDLGKTRWEGQWDRGGARLWRRVATLPRHEGPHCTGGKGEQLDLRTVWGGSCGEILCTIISEEAAAGEGEPWAHARQNNARRGGGKGMGIFTHLGTNQPIGD